MRTAFIETLCEIASGNPDIWLLNGDLGYSVLEAFSRQFPERSLNVGVAEQNLAGVAAGLALSGKIVFTYSIANFPVIRCLEQIRNDICYHQANVKIVAVGGGLAYGPQGYTHHGVEDLALLRVLPHMMVIAPGDPLETRAATRAIAAHHGPCYLRLGKAHEPLCHQTEPQFEIGKAITMSEGRDVALISTGGVLKLTLQAADALRAEGCSVRVISMHTIQPIDKEAIRAAAEECRGIVTVEEHGWGGLGTAVAEVLAGSGLVPGFQPLRLRREPLPIAGSQEMLREAHGISLHSVVAAALRVSGERRGLR